MSDGRNLEMDPRGRGLEVEQTGRELGNTLSIGLTGMSLSAHERVVEKTSATCAAIADAPEV